MAGGTSDYNRGDMSIKGHEKTYGGFMGVSIYGVATLVFILLIPILAFAIGVKWISAVIVSFVVGVLLGLGLKLKGGWYAFLIGSTVILILIGLVVSLF